MQLPFGRTNEQGVLSTNNDNVEGTSSANPGQNPASKPGFWKSLDWKLMLALLFPVTLDTLDYTVIATAQPRIASVFNALPLESYIGTSYLLPSTVFLPFFASVADVYGRHFGLQVSLLFFLFGSALSTGATNMAMILVGRGIAGIGAAGLLTIVRTILSDTVSLDANNLQQSMMFLLYSVGFSVGPVIGGFLVLANFRWVFAINLPCTVIAIVMCFFLLRSRVRGPQTKEELPPLGHMDNWIYRLGMIDWIGTFLFIGGGILILLALNWGPGDNWKTARVVANIAIGIILIILCVLWEIVLGRKHLSPTGESRLFRAYPMLPVELFTSYDLCVVQYSSFVSGIVMFVMFYFVAIFATMVTGLPPSQAGIQLLYFAPGLGGGTLISIRMIKWLRQPLYPIVLGNVIMTVGVGLIQMAMQHNIQSEVNGFMAMAGVGVGTSAGPLVIHARFTKPNHIATTNALLLFVRALGGTIGLAQCFTVMNSKVNSHTMGQILSGALSDSDLAALEALINSGGLDSTTSLSDLPTAVQGIVRNAFLDGVRWSFVSLIPWLGIASVTSLFLSKIGDTDKTRAEDAVNDADAVVSVQGRAVMDDVQMQMQSRSEVDEDAIDGHRDGEKPSS